MVACGQARFGQRVFERGHHRIRIRGARLASASQRRPVTSGARAVPRGYEGAHSGSGSGSISGLAAAAAAAAAAVAGPASSSTLATGWGAPG